MSRPGTREQGFTIIEVLVATLVLVMGALATFGLLSAATRNTQRAKASQVALDRAQQELEALRSLGNEELALEKLPPHSADSLDPDYRVNASVGTFALDRQPIGTYRRLVANGGEIQGETESFVEGGLVKPSEHFESGDVTGTVHRYIVWRNDDVCGSACPTQQDYKQIIVAVKLDTPGNQSGERGYVEAQSNFVNPTDSPKSDPKPNANGDLVTAQQFFLTDTPCAAGGETERAEITGDHLLHNTLGTCASGAQTGSIPGAPDALQLGGPPDPAPDDPTIPGFYDYATDNFLEPTPDTEDRGLQILVDDTTDCHYVPSGKTTAQAQVHRWVTDPMAADFAMTEKVTLEFYTRTLADATHTGTLCVFLYVRHETGPPSEPEATDTPLTNKVGNTPYWTYTPEKNAYWPSEKWEKVRLAMTFNGAPQTIAKDDRLVVGLSVERSNTAPADALAIMYDHPTYPTRIEVDTSTPIEGG